MSKTSKSIKSNLSRLQATIPGFERVVIGVKPDGVKRALTGEILRRMEMLGLKMIAGKMLVPTISQAEGNYPDITTKDGHEWLVNLGRKTLNTYQETGRDVVADHGTNNPEILGQRVYDSLIQYLTSGPMVIMVWEGHLAVSQARALAGATAPAGALPGTIRGDLSFDSQVLTSAQDRRALRNVLHVSGEVDEALKEISLWFGADAEFNDKYIRTDHAAMFGQI
ncbi:nucleoside-diphosphate kinase [Candidatus Collierbacteria bacterium]|nr:nucleoside-diphosphate kinase [Candidatus Collierbacteria bacterium]